MKYCLITFRSVTPAQRAEALLRRSGIDCQLSRTPRPMEELGCGYSLRIRPVDSSRSAMLLRQQQVPFRKIYMWSENGAFEELFV